MVDIGSGEVHAWVTHPHHVVTERRADAPVGPALTILSLRGLEARRPSKATSSRFLKSAVFITGTNVAPHRGRIRSSSDLWVLRGRECFDHVIAFSEAGVRKLMTLYGSYYEKIRASAHRRPRWVRGHTTLC